jgi:hypothetical protein
MAVAQNIKCSHCGAPVEFKPGEIIATCKYCGFTTVIETGQVFIFEHSILYNSYNPDQMDNLIHDWMRSGFMKPSDLSRKSKILELNLIYLPFWVVTLEASTKYKGIFERISPPIVKEGEIKKNYNWLVLARQASDFPTLAYDVPLEGKVPYDFRKIESYAKVLNSEVEREQAIERARQQIDVHHRFLLQEDIDRVVEATTTLTLDQIVYLHAPVWFIRYEYKGNNYQMLIDGAKGMVLKGDIPNAKF